MSASCWISPGGLRLYQVSGWYVSMTPDMTFYSGLNQVKTKGFTAAGAPIYDIANPTKMPGSGGGGGMGVGAGLGTVDGTSILNNGQYGVDRTTLESYDLVTGKF